MNESSNELREALADYAHEAWSGWMRYMLSGMRGWPNADGSWTISPNMRQRWERQMQTPYESLSESEKESDRAEADKMLAILYPALDKEVAHGQAGLVAPEKVEE